MLTYVIRRVLYSIPVLLVASMIVFFGISSVGDPLATVRMQPNVSQETVQNIVEREHLDEPLITRYGYWVEEALTEQFGSRLLAQTPIWPDLWRAFKNTLQLVIAAEIIALTLAILLGVLSARYQYSFFDYTTTTVSFFGFSVPIFWFALILQVIFVNIYTAFDVRIFYTSGLSSIDPGTGWAFFVDRVRHLALPILALSYVSIAQYSRYMRASMLEVLGADYIKTARAKGLKESRVTLKHALRNALIPVVTVAALNLGTVFGGVIITETIFSLDGMGLFFIEALGAREINSVMAWMMLTGVLIVAFNLVADILYGYLDPRIRYE